MKKIAAAFLIAAFCMLNTAADDYYVYSDEYGVYEETENMPTADFGTVEIILIAGLPLIIAAVLTSGKMKLMNTAISQNSAGSYIKNGSLNITASKDTYLYSNIIKTPRPKNNNSHK